MTRRQRFEVWRARRQERVAERRREKHHKRIHATYARMLPVCREVGHEWAFRSNTSAGSSYVCDRCGAWHVTSSGFRPPLMGRFVRSEALLPDTAEE